MTGPECSGRTSVALSLIARLTEANKVCAWIDTSNTFDPGSAAAVGVDLAKLLWVRCGVQRATESQASRRFVLTCEPNIEAATRTVRTSRRPKHYDTIEQGLRSADLILQTGGFSALVLDLGSIAPEHVSRIELSTWHRYRVAAERTQAMVLLLTQYPCAKRSSELQLRFSSATESEDETTVFSAIEPNAEIVRRRFVQAESNVIPLHKPPQNQRISHWQHRTTWAVQR